MQFIHAFDIWSVPTALLKNAQPGQWVYAGNPADKGRFLGVKKSGVVVVAWHGNAKNQGNYGEYVKTLRQYAKG